MFEAFDVEALHYIVKNQTTDKKFEEIFLKAIERSKRRSVETLSLSCAGEYRNIPISSVRYFEVQNRIVTVYYRELDEIKSFEFYAKLSQIEESLYGRGFVRIHRAYLVAEKQIQKRTQREVRLLDGTILPVGKTYRVTR